MEPPGNAATSRSKASRSERQDPGHRGDQVLHGGRPLEPAQARDADGAGPADPPEVVAQDVDDHHVLRAILGARQQLPRQRPVLGRVAPARARALDRVGHDDPLGSDRQERLGRRGQQGPGPAAELPGTEVQVRGEEGGIARPEAAVQLPRIAVERRLEPAREVGLVDVAGGDVVADPRDAGLDRPPGSDPSERPADRWAPGRPPPSGRRMGIVRRAWTSSSRRASRRASPSSARPPSQAWPVRRSQATIQSWSASRSGGRSWSAGAMAGRRSSTAPRS